MFFLRLQRVFGADGPALRGTSRPLSGKSGIISSSECRCPDPLLVFISNKSG